MSDRIFASICIALAVLMAWGATIIEESFIQDPLGPKAFPLVIALVLAACGVAMFLRPDEDPVWPHRRKQIQLLWTIGALVLYVQFLPVVGFLIATAIGAVYASKEWKATMASSGLAPLDLQGTAFQAFVKDSVQSIQTLSREIGLIK